ncbi:cyclin-L1-like [Nilaparvata lugens]|uniref:cyclin-L1-like n=1 Tax=Nilaparvata lugens TaxID=108931 RepID=UPI00193E174A|nr:cyclin-L1-like [Nilaparvata lugens]
MDSQKPENNVSHSKTVTKPYGKIVMSLNNCLLPESKLSLTPSKLDGLDSETETDLRILGCEMIQTGGILLRLPQVAMATGQILFQRFYYSKSFMRYPMETTAMACLFLASKVEDSPRRIRDVMSVFHHIEQIKSQKTLQPMQLNYHYIILEKQVIMTERRVLEELGYCVHVKNPHKIIVMYLQVLGYEKPQPIIQLSWNYMNDSLRSDVFMRYDPETVACACIYLSARKLRIPLPKQPPWFGLFGISEDHIVDVCKRILRLYQRAKVNAEELEKKMGEIKKKHQEACGQISGSNALNSGVSPSARRHVEKHQSSRWSRLSRSHSPQLKLRSHLRSRNRLLKHNRSNKHSRTRSWSGTWSKSSRPHSPQYKLRSRSMSRNRSLKHKRSNKHSRTQSRSRSRSRTRSRSSRSHSPQYKFRSHSRSRNRSIKHKRSNKHSRTQSRSWSRSRSRTRSRSSRSHSPQYKFRSRSRSRNRSLKHKRSNKHSRTQSRLRSRSRPRFQTRSRSRSRPRNRSRSSRSHSPQYKFRSRSRSRNRLLKHKRSNKHSRTRSRSSSQFRSRSRPRFQTRSRSRSRPRNRSSIKDQISTAEHNPVPDPGPEPVQGHQDLIRLNTSLDHVQGQEIFRSSIKDQISTAEHDPGPLLSSDPGPVPGSKPGPDPGPETVQGHQDLIRLNTSLDHVQGQEIVCSSIKDQISTAEHDPGPVPGSIPGPVPGPNRVPAL